MEMWECLADGTIDYMIFEIGMFESYKSTSDSRTNPFSFIRSKENLVVDGLHVF